MLTEHPELMEGTTRGRDNEDARGLVCHLFFFSLSYLHLHLFFCSFSCDYSIASFVYYFHVALVAVSCCCLFVCLFVCFLLLLMLLLLSRNFDFNAQVNCNLRNQV
jgi:hypothetical protein